jgi:hypothetical protein
VEVLNGGVDIVDATTVPAGGITLSEVVGLDVVVVSSNPLQIDLVQVRRLEDNRGNDTDARGGLANNIDTTKENPLAACDRRCLAQSIDAELGSLVRAQRVVKVVGLGEVGAVALGVVARDLLVTQSRRGRAV